jgi:hypothetical protein
MRATLLVVALFAVACPAPPPVDDPDGGEPPPPAGDAGPLVDGGAPPEDAGPPIVDAGPRPGEGEACSVLVEPPCDPGLHCLLPNLIVTEGVCRPSCGVLDGEGEVIGEDPSLCEGENTCQTLTTPTLRVLGAICQPPVATRDATCEAPGDADACAGDLSCEVIFSEPILGEVFIDAPRCKAACDFEGGGACDAPDACLPPTDPLSDGLCGRPVPLWSGAPVPQGVELCNEISAHDYCDRRPFLALAEPALVECLTGIFVNEDQGLCTAQCSQPTFDQDGNGTIDSDEEAFDLDCPAGTVCALDISRDNGLVVPSSPAVACDDFVCPPGTPCSTCPNNVECYPDLSGGSTCAAVLGYCSPAPPVVDAGPDAGLDGG